MRIFGREPTVVIQTLATLLSLLVAFGFDGLSAEQAALIIAAIYAGLGAVNALAVRPIAPAAFIGAVGAVAALAASYGLDFSQEQIGSVSAALVSVIVLLTRSQVTPTEA
jgi:uncharacterized protein (DUF697 family)